MTAPTAEPITAAEALLVSRCAAIDLHYQRFPNSPDRTMEDTAKAMRALLTELATLRECVRLDGEALVEIAAIEPKPFEGGLDMEAIRACEECKRYEGHPVQHGICNTHRRPIWDREKHDSHAEKTLGYRAKSLARARLSARAEG